MDVGKCTHMSIALTLHLLSISTWTASRIPAHVAMWTGVSTALFLSVQFTLAPGIHRTLLNHPVRKFRKFGVFFRCKKIQTLPYNVS